jgi:hypothetical protein
MRESLGVVALPSQLTVNLGNYYMTGHIKNLHQCTSDQMMATFLFVDFNTLLK